MNSSDKKKMNRLSRKRPARTQLPEIARRLKGCPASCVHLLVLTLSLLVGVFPAELQALPSGGTVQGGSATIHSPDSGTLNIQQSTQRAIIDWIHFNIQSDEQVHFNLPSSDSVNLSRVTGGSPSEIFGKLTSNGNLFLINPNGILFGQSARVDVNGLVATTSDISNQDFMAGNYRFNTASPFNRSVVNRGHITVKQGGLAAFVAPGVENSGIIQARLGRVSLVSGKTFTLDLYGDQLVSLGLGSQVTGDVIGPNGLPMTSRVNNSGNIFADGGVVTLEVNAARNLVDNAINMSGVIQARTAEQKNGEIYLKGGEMGTVTVTGTLDASGYGEGETGGIIHVLGDRIFLDDYGFIDISGDYGAGTLLMGGDYQGKGTVQNATDTYVGKNAKIWADAKSQGDGGRVILWADRRNYFLGRVRARGGELFGDGGFVEVSGKETLFFNGYVDTTAMNGETGTLLLDPGVITIEKGTGNPDDINLPDINASGSGTVSFTITDFGLENLSATTNINLFAEDDIIIKDLSGDPLALRQTAGFGISMTAQNGDITFDNQNDELSTAGGNITLKAGGDMTLGKLNAGTGTVSIFGKDEGTISLGTATGGLNIDNQELQNITAGNVVIGGSTEAEGRARDIVVDGVTMGPNATTTTLRALLPQKSISGIPPVLIPAGTVSFGTTASTFSNTGLTAQAFDGVNVDSNLTSSGNLSLDGDFNNSDDMVGVNSPDGVNLASGVALTSTGGQITLKGTSNGIVAAGGLILNAATGVSLNNKLSMGGSTSITTTSGSTNLREVDGNQALVLNGGTGTVNLDGAIGGGTALSSLTVNGTSNTVLSGINITTNNGNVTFNNSVALDTGATSISTGAGGGNIAFNSAIDGNQSLTLSPGGGTVTLSGNVGASTALNSLTVNGPTTMNGTTLNANNGVTFDGNVTASSGLALNADADNSGGGTFTQQSGQLSTGNNALSITAQDVALTGTLSSGTGTTTIAASQNGAMSLGDATGGLHLSSTDLATKIAAGSLVFGNSTTGTISVDNVTNTLATIMNGTGITFQGANSQFGSLTANGPTTINNGVDISTTAGNLAFNGAVTANAGAVQLSTTGGTLSFSSTVDGGADLTLNPSGGTIFGGNVGATTALNSLTVNGTTTMNGTTLNANNGVTFNGNVTASSGLALNADADNSGGGTFDQQSGQLSTGNNALSITAQDVTLAGMLSSGTGTTTIAASQNGAMSLGDATGGLRLSNADLGQITAGALVFGNGTGLITVDNVNNMVATTFNGTGTTFQTANSQFGALTVSGPTTINNGIDLSTTGGDMTFNGAVMANAGAVQLSTTGGNLSFSSTVDGGADLTLMPSGTVTFGGNVGATTALNSLNVTGATTMNGSVLKANNGITLSGNFTRNGDLTINSDANANGTGVFTFNNGTFSTTNGTLSLTASDISLGATGLVNTGTGLFNMFVSNNGTIGLGAANCGGTCDMTLSGAELTNITTAGLSVSGTASGTGGALFVDGVTAGQSANLGNVTLDSGGLATFDNASTFKGLSVRASDIAINDTLDVSSGNLSIGAANGGSLGVGAATGKVMTVDETELGRLRANNLMFSTTGSLTLDGVTIDGSKITNEFSSIGGSLSIQNGLVVPVDTFLGTQTVGQGITLNHANNFFGGKLRFGTVDGDVSISNFSNNGQALNLATSAINGAFSLNTSTNILFSGGFMANGLVDIRTTQGIVFNDGAFLNAGAGPLRLNTAGDLVLGQLITTSNSSEAISLMVGGAVIDAGDTGGEDIIAVNGGLFARTRSGFGTVDNPIETRVQSIDIVNSGSGDIGVFETDDLHINNLEQGNNGDIFVSYFGNLTGGENIEFTLGFLEVVNRENGFTFSQEVGDTGKERDELAVERTVNVVNELEALNGANRFEWQKIHASPAAVVKRAGINGEPNDDVYERPFALLEVEGGAGEDGDLAQLEDVWHWNHPDRKKTRQAKVKKEKVKKAKKNKDRKKEKIRAQTDKPKKKKKESAVLSFFKSMGEAVSR